MEEIWKAIKGFESYYEVSNLGNIRSLNRNVKSGIHNWKLKSRILKPRKDRNGYYSVSISFNGIVKQFLIHRLVAFEFVEGFNETLEVNHKDFDKTNNKANNLEWCTKSENHKHLYKNNQDSYIKRENFQGIGDKNPRAILKEEDVLFIRENCANNKITRKEATLIYGVSKSAIDSIMTRKNWKHI